jgi:hypothetical protein
MDDPVNFEQLVQFRAPANLSKAIDWAASQRLPRSMLTAWGPSRCARHLAPNWLRAPCRRSFLPSGFFGNPYSIPVGGLLPFTGTTAPNSSFVLPYGQAVSRADGKDWPALIRRPKVMLRFRPRTLLGKTSDRASLTRTMALGGERALRANL